MNRTKRAAAVTAIAAMASLGFAGVASASDYASHYHGLGLGGLLGSVVHLLGALL